MHKNYIFLFWNHLSFEIIFSNTPLCHYHYYCHFLTKKILITKNNIVQQQPTHYNAWSIFITINTEPNKLPKNKKLKKLLSCIIKMNTKRWRKKVLHRRSIFSAKASRFTHLKLTNKKREVTKNENGFFFVVLLFLITAAANIKVQNLAYLVTLRWQSRIFTFKFFSGFLWNVWFYI